MSAAPVVVVVAQDRGRDQHFYRHNTLAKRLHLLARQEGKGKAGQNSGVGRIMCLRSLGHDWPAVKGSSHGEPLQ